LVRLFVPVTYPSEDDHTAVIIKITEMLLSKMKITIQTTFTDPTAYSRETPLLLENGRRDWESSIFQRLVASALV
jgi:hypothetical protein